MYLNKIVASYMRRAVNDLEAGNTNLSAEQLEEAASVFAHVPVSKEEACVYLEISRSTFDSLVRQGKIPKGRKRRGFKELAWYKDELLMYKLSKKE